MGNDIVGDVLSEVSEGLRPFVARELRKKYPVDPDYPNDPDLRTADLQALIKIITLRDWVDPFKGIFMGTDARPYLEELRGARNRWAHQKPFSQAQVQRICDTAVLLLELPVLSAGKQAAALRRLCGRVSSLPSGPQRVHNGRYQRLRGFLAQIPANQSSVSLPFKEVEKILRAKLPESAYKHRPWWANHRGNVQGQSWMDAGWQTKGVDLTSRKVTFARAHGP
jgi:hypothetical protein